MDIQKASLKIGDYQICPVPTGQFGLDGGAMFGTVPKVLWEQSNPPDEKNRIPMEARALLLKGSKHKILIDTGNGSDFVAKYGDKVGGKFSEIYAVDQNGPSLLKSLAGHGVKPEDVTHVILTHLHFDHAGGATTEKNGEIVATFPKAKYYVQRANFETATKPNIREKASYLAPNFEPLMKAGVLELLDGDKADLLPGVSVQVSNGHTRGQQVVKVSDGTNTLLYCGDVIPTSSHVRLPWVMGYDLEPLRLIEEKATFLEPASSENWYLYFEHDPYCDAATVEKKGPDFKVKDRFHL
ncbi:MAG: MBL fold metallo-hydrolase [Bdellovibrionaceae bacterium]|nr:MBL fold metallo-hydrolase [Pseudobdellovibrionaceae bacterium]